MWLIRYLYVKIGIKYQYVSQCALIHALLKRLGCALIGACALIRTNTVILLFLFVGNWCSFWCME